LLCRVTGQMDQFDAAERGDLQQLRRLLTTNNVNDVDVRRNCGKTSLHWAAMRGHVECVKLCLEMGANVNSRDINEDTALPFACAKLNGNADVARILLDAGAFVDCTSIFGRTPLYFAVRYNFVNVARLLLDRGAKVSNVKLGNRIPAIPDWVNAITASRSLCRLASICIVGIHKYHRTAVTGNNDINVLKLISKHIWSTRMDDVWMESPVEPKKMK
jgi:ankyrin repeat protein